MGPGGLSNQLNGHAVIPERGTYVYTCAKPRGDDLQQQELAELSSTVPACSREQPGRRLLGALGFLA